MMGDATLVFWQAHAELHLVVFLGSNFRCVHTWRRKNFMRWTRAVHRASGETKSQSSSLSAKPTAHSASGVWAIGV
jgi:hypothetical protein